MKGTSTGVNVINDYCDRNYHFINYVQLKNGDDFGILYAKDGIAYFTKGQQFENYANSATIAEICMFVLLSILFTLL